MTARGATECPGCGMEILDRTLCSCTVLAVGKIDWNKVTANHHTADLDGCASIDVVRSHRWRRNPTGKTWRVVLFGNPHVVREMFERVEDAMQVAEREALKRIGAMAARMGWKRP